MSMGGPGDHWLAIPLVVLGVLVVLINEVWGQTVDTPPGVETVAVVPWQFVVIVLSLGALAVVIGVVQQSGIVPTTFGGDRS